MVNYYTITHGDVWSSACDVVINYSLLAKPSLFIDVGNRLRFKLFEAGQGALVPAATAVMQMLW